jgi:hypothetical protein
MSITEVEADYYYDFHVPVYENYWACGIFHHNTGKSTFLGRLADACIAEGEGVLLIDPKGDLAEEVAKRTEHPDKLIYISPGLYPNRSFTLNVLEVPTDDPCREAMRDIAAANMLRMMEHIGGYDRETMMLIDTYLRAAVKTAFTKEQPTLIDVLAVLLLEEERKELLEQTRHEEIRVFWKNFEKRNPAEQRSQIDSTMRRLWPYLLDTATNRFVASPTSTLKLTQWLNDGMLVVVNLADRLPIEDADRMGNLIVSHMAAQYRLRSNKLLPQDTDRRWRLIVDEFHRFSPSPYADIIRTGRSANFFPVVAHQDAGQLRKKDYLTDSLGHASQLAFRRSSGDVPTSSYQAQAQFVTAQAEMQKHEADWTHRSPTGTTTTRLRMLDWQAAAKPNQLETAAAQALQFTLPKSDIPSSRDRFKAWGQGGTMESDANQRSAKETRKNPPPPHPPVRHEPDSTRDGGAGAGRPVRATDLFSGGQDALLGGGDDQGSPKRSPGRPKGR